MQFGTANYHIVWCPKYRFKMMNGAVQKSVKEIISQLCEWKKLEILELNVLEDHVHLVISIPSLSQPLILPGFPNEYTYIECRNTP